MEEVLGSTFVGQKGNEMDSTTLNYPTELIGVYFAANWCKNCSILTPKLADFYKEINNLVTKFEIVYVNNDQSLEAFETTKSEMPWMSIPFSNQQFCTELRTKYSVSAMPTLIIFRPDGTILTRNGRSDVENDIEKAFMNWGGSP